MSIQVTIFTLHYKQALRRNQLLFAQNHLINMIYLRRAHHLGIQLESNMCLFSLKISSFHMEVNAQTAAGCIQE